jgi:hypothetical protein
MVKTNETGELPLPVQKNHDRFSELGKELYAIARARTQLKKSEVNSSKYTRAVQELITAEAITNKLERILVVPVNGFSMFQMIFGYGDVITDKDLFVLYSKKNKKIKYLPFKEQKAKHYLRSTDALQNEFDKYLHNDKTVVFSDYNPRDTKRKKVSGTSIELIKQNTLVHLQNHFNGSSQSFLIKPPGRHKYILLNPLLLKYHTSSFVLLRDVTNLKINLISGRSKFAYNPYRIIRDFLRAIDNLTERRMREKKRVVYTKTMVDTIKDSIESYQKEDTYKNLYEIVAELRTLHSAFKRAPKPTRYYISFFKKRYPKYFLPNSST